MAQLHELWSLREDVTVECGSGEDALRLRGRWGDVTVKRPSSLVHEALRRMSLGPVSLENVIGTADGGDAQAKREHLHRALERLNPLIVRSLSQEWGDPVLSVVPLAERSRFRPEPLAPGVPVRMSVYARLRANGRECSIESPLALHRVMLHQADAVRLIAPLMSPITPASYLAAVAAADPVAQHALEYLVAAGMAVIGEPSAGGTFTFAEDCDPATVGWSQIDMMFHTRSTLGRHDHDFGATCPIAPLEPPVKPLKPPARELVPLHRPRLEELRATDPPLTAVIEGRRSSRHPGTEITAEQIGDLLYRTARVRRLAANTPGDFCGHTDRPYPSGGSAYELELYLSVGDCAGLAPGVYHYDPLGHRLERVDADRVAAEELLGIARMAAGTDVPLPVLITMTARFRRLSWRYEGMAYRLVLMNAGALMQNLYLVCTAMRLAPCAIGTISIDTAARALGTDWRVEPCVAQFMVGSQPASTLGDGRAWSDVNDGWWAGADWGLPRWPRELLGIAALAAHYRRMLEAAVTILARADLALRGHCLMTRYILEAAMQATWAGRLRCQIFLPDQSEVKFERRGFHAPDSARQENLEKVGTIFLKGFAYGMGGRSIPEIESSLESIEPAFRGFAYEGCAMALGVRDGIAPVRRHWVSDLLASRGGAHIYMAYIGVGWAMARLPRLRWRAIEPRDPLLRWLVLDGYGFHQAYFRTSQYLARQYQAPIAGWPSDYANRVVDQGIGRALWFANGSDVSRVADAIVKFAPARQADLWSGAGLASVYAGGVDAGELEDMVRLAGEYRAHAAQGAVFAASARQLAGLVTPGTELGAKVHCGMSAQEAAAVADEARLDLPTTDGPVPAFEV
ncbi:MAG TPA: DUF1702 family protein, partial [Trebonia sp.]